MCLTSWSSVTLWSLWDFVFDQYAIPLLCTTKYIFCPSDFVSFTNQLADTSQEEIMWYVGVEGRKIKAIKLSGSFGCINFLSFLRTSVALSIIQKQLAPVFRVIPSQYCLKCLVISLRLDACEQLRKWFSGACTRSCYTGFCRIFASPRNSAGWTKVNMWSQMSDLQTH